MPFSARHQLTRVGHAMWIPSCPSAAIAGPSSGQPSIFQPSSLTRMGSPKVAPLLSSARRQYRAGCRDRCGARPRRPSRRGDDRRLAAETDIGLNQCSDGRCHPSTTHGRCPAAGLRRGDWLGRALAVRVSHRRGVAPVEPHHLDAAVVPERRGVPSAGAGQRRTRDGNGRGERPAAILRARVTNHGMALTSPARRRARHCR